MSNLPPPPSPGGGTDQPPPPPPPDLIAPAGYAGYTPTPLDTLRLRRVGGVGRAAVILVGMAAVFNAATVLISQTNTTEAQAYLDGLTTQEDFVTAIAPYLLLTFVQGAAVIGSIVLVMIWMFRLAANHRALHRGATWGPGWAIGGWFLPPLLYIIPTLMFRELWRASDPEIPVGGDWRRGAVSPLITAWFILYSLIPIALMFAQNDTVLSGIGGSEEELAKQIAGGQGTVIASTVVTVMAAAVFIAMARSLTARHRQLTGEAIV